MGRFKKGSPEAKEHMAKIRKKREKPVETRITTPEPEDITTGNTGIIAVTEPEVVTVTTSEPVVTETLEAEEQRLAEELQDGMPTKKEMTDCPPGTIHKHLNWEKKNKEKIVRWKAIRRELYPADTNTANLENIRTKGGD